MCDVSPLLAVGEWGAMVRGSREVRYPFVFVQPRCSRILVFVGDRVVAQSVRKD